MDILAQYDKQFPEQKQAPQNMYGNAGDYGPIVSFIIRLSRGRIQNERQANTVLLGMIIFMLVFIVLIYNIASPGTVPPIKSITTQDVLPR